MQNIVRKETISIEVLFAAQDPKPVFKFLFPDNENLRNSRIFGFQMYYNTIAKFDLLYKRKLIDKATIQSTFVDMFDKKNNNFVKFCPAIVFQTIQDNEFDSGTTDAQINERDAKYFTGQIIDFANCYFSVVNSPALTFDTKFTFLFDVFYTRIDLDDVNPIKYN